MTTSPDLVPTQTAIRTQIPAPIDPWDVVRQIKNATRDRTRQRSIARRCGEQFLAAMHAAQWASSMVRWMRTGSEIDRQALLRAATRCAEHPAPPTRLSSRSSIVR
jgi:hypothetical protein